jgi:hypothetical protein
VPELLVEAIYLFVLLDREGEGLSGDARQPIGDYFVGFQRKGAPPRVERPVLTGVSNVEQGEAGLELGEQKLRADLVKTAS